LERGAREAADHGILRALGNLVDGGKVAVRGNRKAGLDDVDAHGVEQLGNLDLLFMGHGRARALLAVAQRGVEYDDAVLLGLGSGHRIDPSRDVIWPTRPSGRRSLNAYARAGRSGPFSGNP